MNGKIRHLTGSLTPTPNASQQFAQLYMLDPAETTASECLTA